jgi:chromosome segregation ATPase
MKKSIGTIIALLSMIISASVVVADKTIDCNDCQNALQSCQDELAQTKTSLASCQDNLETCQDSNPATSQDNLATCQDNLATCKDEYNTKEDNFNICEQDLAIMNNKLHQKDLEINSLNEQLMNCTNNSSLQIHELDALKLQLKTLQTELDKYNKK